MTVPPLHANSAREGGGGGLKYQILMTVPRHRGANTARGWWVCLPVLVARRGKEVGVETVCWVESWGCDVVGSCWPTYWGGCCWNLANVSDILWSTAASSPALADWTAACTNVCSNCACWITTAALCVVEAGREEERLVPAEVTVCVTGVSGDVDCWGSMGRTDPRT